MIYLDNASTTKVDSRVFDEMRPYFMEVYGNASSNHEFGQIAKSAIEKSRKQVASLLNADESEIYFTSGATESINFALKGFLDYNFEKGNHIITVKTEHKAVLATCDYLEQRGVNVTYLNVDNDGLISLQDLEDAITEDTVLITVMYVNNETGVIQPIRQIGEIAKQHNIVFFTDATQAVGKISIDVKVENIDMLCFSGHKLNAPKGIGVLYKRKGIDLTPLLHGGGQENGLRGGTYNTPLIVGLGKACELCQNETEQKYQLVKELYSYINQGLKSIKGSVVLSSNTNKVHSIINILIPGLNSEIFISKSNDVMVSNGSACTSNIVESSHVLKAMGISDIECRESFRISLDANITKREIDLLLDKIKTEQKLY